MMHIGKAIKIMRAFRGYSLSKTCYRCKRDISKAWLNLVERGDNPGTETLVNLCEALDITQSQLEVLAHRLTEDTTRGQAFQVIVMILGRDQLK